MNDRAASSAHGAVHDAVIPYDTDAADDVEVEVQDHVDSVLAAIRRRRGGRDASQGRIYKRLRMRLRDWTNLTTDDEPQAQAASQPDQPPQLPQPQQPHPHDPTIEATPDPEPPPQLHPPTNDASPQAPPIPEDPLPLPTSTSPITAASPTPSRTLRTTAHMPPLPRDHLILLVPPTPCHSSAGVYSEQERDLGGLLDELVQEQTGVHVSPEGGETYIDGARVRPSVFHRRASYLDFAVNAQRPPE
ncbi:hypothetical protein S7711_03389 [Stachybotrys chartarum IBT 7711]|uniref:Uncharacterized protein n=1 Tax=Stachybotrys chartarum (strain CBS 109288 / IBT 7711) TaxID=1280523 RepID=A0A084AXY8_STACB|nr:hypothetical protein S7711_03389 [Stachybotrys chartarum IBT 7711]KFA46838.1 hypothetical protein S40293_05615 [Stachybotrys chartarum IBT 40293]